MKHKYYSIPLDFTDLFHNDTHVESSGRSHDRLLKKISSLKRSINEHIELIIMTHMGEYKNNKDYGFVLWDREFKNVAFAICAEVVIRPMKFVSYVIDTINRS